MAEQLHCLEMFSPGILDGLDNEFGNVTVDNTTFDGTGKSNAIGVYINSATTIHQSTMLNNTYGVFNTLGSLTLENTTIANNQEGIYIGGGTTNLNNSTLSQNNYSGIVLNPTDLVYIECVQQHHCTEWRWK